jgi:hypothetical protein
MICLFFHRWRYSEHFGGLMVWCNSCKKGWMLWM